MPDNTPAAKLHTAKWIARLHEIVDADASARNGLRLTGVEADELISLIAKQRNQISNLTRSRDHWRDKARAASKILGRCY